MSLDKWIHPDRPPKDPYSDIIGKPLGDRKLIDVRGEWKTDICAPGGHYRILKPSKDVRVSSLDRIFLECIQNAEIPDGEGIWNEYYRALRIEIEPVTFHKWLRKLIKLGLIERIDGL